jgi:ribosomal protein L40E
MSVALARQAPYPVRVQQRRCGKCGKLVSRAAYACRRCGKSQRLRPRSILLAMAGGLMVAMFGVAGAGALMPQAHPPETSLSGAERLASAAPATSARMPEVSASEMGTAYRLDATAADRAYRERSLVVTGTVRSVDRDYQGDMVVRLGTEDAFDTVNATLAARNDPAVASLVKGRAVSLICVGRGSLMGAPLLGSCFLR